MELKCSKCKMKPRPAKQRYCRECRADYLRRWRLANHEKCLAYDRKYRERRKADQPAN